MKGTIKIGTECPYLLLFERKRIMTDENIYKEKLENRLVEFINGEFRRLRGHRKFFQMPQMTEYIFEAFSPFDRAFTREFCTKIEKKFYRNGTVWICKPDSLSDMVSVMMKYSSMMKDIDQDNLRLLADSKNEEVVTVLSLRNGIGSNMVYNTVMHSRTEGYIMMRPVILIPEEDKDLTAEEIKGRFAFIMEEFDDGMCSCTVVGSNTFIMEMSSTNDCYSLKSFTIVKPDYDDTVPALLYDYKD